MHHHTRWFLYIVLVAFIFLMWFFLHRGLSHTDTLLLPTTSSPGDTLSYTEKVISSKDNYATYDIHYPEFKNVDVSFNKKIEDTVLSAKKEFSQNAEANWKAYRENVFEGGDPGEFPTDPYPFYVKWDNVQANDSYVSILLHVSGYNGGAHGYENIVSFNYDVKAQKELTIRDFFPNDPAYLQTLSDFSRTALLPHLIETEGLDTMGEDERNQLITSSVQPMIEDGTTPTVENFSVFTFANNALTIYFGQYQVAPYVAGIQKVVYPLQ